MIEYVLILIVKNSSHLEEYAVYYSGHRILANIFLTFLKKNDVNQSLASLINDNY
jgi:hypothetical protein